MQLVTSTYPVEKRFGDEKAIQMLADAGFDALDYSAFHMKNEDSPLGQKDYKDYAIHLKNIAYQNNISFVQAHAPIPLGCSNIHYINDFKKCIIRAMEVASVMGAQVIVVHPLHYLEYDDNKFELYNINMEFYRELIPYAQRLNIKIACENLFQVNAKGNVVDSVCASYEEYNKYIDTISSSWFTACLDIGHCKVCGRKAQDVIRAMGRDRITALHIHDNNGITDLHKLPGMVSEDWNEICKALAEINYTGNFTFEVNGLLDAYGDEFVPTVLKFMHDTGRYFMSKIKAGISIINL